MANNNNPHLDSVLLAKIRAQEGKDHIRLSSILVGGKVTFETMNSVYHIEKVEIRPDLSDIWLIQGGTRWAIPTRVYIPGSTFGGSVIKTDTLEDGMRVEIHEQATGKIVSTSPVVNLWEHTLEVEQ